MNCRCVYVCVCAAVYELGLLDNPKQVEHEYEGLLPPSTMGYSILALSLHSTPRSPRCTNAQDSRIRSVFGTGKKEQGDARGLVFRTIEWQQQANARLVVDICFTD